ncbi:MAG: hydantoinase B/oxoprolinase family protein [Candidatus Hodarchaeota archaeon]
MKVDATSFNIISHAFLSITQEMGINLLKVAYSSIVREAKDTSVCLLDREGRVVAQAAYIPIHMNSLSSSFEYFASNFSLSDVRPGEAFITNDPYSMGQHLNDIILFLPIFYKDNVIGFSGNISHHLDIGGGAPGPFAGATEIYQEGIRFPPVKINVEKDLNGGLIEKILAANVRSHKVLGDFHAQIAAVRTGEKRLIELAEKYGVDLVLACMDEIQNYSEKIVRNEISKVPDGEYEGEDYIDAGNRGDKPVRVHVIVRISGSNVTVDLSKTDDQVGRPSNSPLASTQSAVYTFFIDLFGRDVPANDGCYRPVHIIARKGSLLDPIFPAPLRARMEACYRVFTALKRAFSKALPQRVVASGLDSCNSVGFGYRTEDKYEIYLEIIEGGNGAGCNNDGASGISQLLVNIANIPIELLENNHDFVRVLSYELIQDSGGAGKYRGGLGIRKSYEILSDDVLLLTNGGRFKYRPWGICGGKSGDKTSYTIIRNGKRIKLPGLNTLTLKKGDVFVAETAGGGGYGNPKERDRKLVDRDLLEENISLENAKEVYGFR